MRAEPSIPFPHLFTAECVLLEPFSPSKDHHYPDTLSFTADSWHRWQIAISKFPVGMSRGNKKESQ